MSHCPEATNRIEVAEFESSQELDEWLKRKATVFVSKKT